MKYQLKQSGKGLLREPREYSDLNGLMAREFDGQSAWILFWEQYRVDFAWFDGKEIRWPEEKAADMKYLMEARAFSKNKEVFVRNQDGRKLSGRVLEEIETDDDVEVDFAFAKVQEPYMWGSIVENGCIREERGMEYHLPFTREAKDIRFGYQAVQYYVPDPDDGMLKLMDYRLSGVYQEIDKKKLFLNGGGIENGNVY